MLMIRLLRVGRKHIPTFRVVVTDKRNSTKSGRFLEILGDYDPRSDKTPTLKNDRITHWLSVGAQPSGTVHNLLVDAKLLDKKKVNVLPKKHPPKKEAAKGEPSPTASSAEVAPAVA